MDADPPDSTTAASLSILALNPLGKSVTTTSVPWIMNSSTNISAAIVISTILVSEAVIAVSRVERISSVNGDLKSVEELNGSVHAPLTASVPSP